jgi:hypothetical protein
MRAVPLLLVLGAYVLGGVFYASVMVSHDYEVEYLVLGSLATRGEIGLYQDELTGQWVPLPFYVFGATQLGGPHLFVPRLVSVALGAVALVLVWAIGTAWAGPLAGAAATGLCVANGLVSGNFALVGFASLVALVHLLAVWVAWCTGWRHRDLLAMAIAASLFLIKPNYWPTIPFLLGYLAWRTPSWPRRAALAAVALGVPVAFFALEPAHLKLLAYVPGLRALVDPLGYRAWFSLLEDAAHLGTSEYFDASWGTTLAGRLAQLARTLLFFGKRYALWLLLLAALAAWAVRRRRDLPRGPLAGVVFALALFWYLAAWQFVILGPWSKQAVGYAAAVAPLLGLALGTLFAVLVTAGARTGRARAAAMAALVAVIVASPWIHRDHNLPRRAALGGDTTLAVFARSARAFASLLPADEPRVFTLADPMPLYLAGRRGYLRQMHQHRWMFTSLRDPDRYRRSGLWGPAEVEAWLGTDARYAVIESEVLDFYARRPPFRPILDRMAVLLAERFTMVGRFEAKPGDWITVYRRRA